MFSRIRIRNENRKFYHFRHEVIKIDKTIILGRSGGRLKHIDSLACFPLPTTLAVPYTAATGAIFKKIVVVFVFLKTFIFILQTKCLFHEVQKESRQVGTPFLFLYSVNFWSSIWSSDSH